MSPIAPRRPCRHPSCGQLVSGGSYCEKHTKAKEVAVKVERIRYDKERGTAHSRGYDGKWSKAAKQFRVNNPLCKMCEQKGILKVNFCVDHIVPVTGPDDPLFWDQSNWQGLCLTCHSEKTAREDGAFGNEKKGRFL